MSTDTSTDHDRYPLPDHRALHKALQVMKDRVKAFEQSNPLPCSNKILEVRKCNGKIRVMVVNEQRPWSDCERGVKVGSCYYFQELVELSEKRAVEFRRIVEEALEDGA